MELISRTFVVGKSGTKFDVEIYRDNEAGKTVRVFTPVLSKETTTS